MPLPAAISRSLVKAITFDLDSQKKFSLECLIFQLNEASKIGVSQINFEELIFDYAQ